MFLNLKWEDESIIKDLFQPMAGRVIKCRSQAIEVLALLVRDLHREFEIRRGMEGKGGMLGKAQTVLKEELKRGEVRSCGSLRRWGTGLARGLRHDWACEAAAMKEKVRALDVDGTEQGNVVGQKIDCGEARVVDMGD